MLMEAAVTGIKDSQQNMRPHLTGLVYKLVTYNHTLTQLQTQYPDAAAGRGTRVSYGNFSGSSEPGCPSRSRNCPRHDPTHESGHGRLGQVSMLLARRGPGVHRPVRGAATASQIPQLPAALLDGKLDAGSRGGGGGREEEEEEEEEKTLRCLRAFTARTNLTDTAEGLNTSSVFHNISLSTVMRCEGKQKCSLHLRIKTALQLTESIHGLSVCTITAGMMMNCRIVSFSRSSRERMSGLQVEVENDCTDVSPNQQVQVMVKTVPSYCGVIWAGTYDAPQCISEDLRRNVPECITGRLSYDINPERKELNISVSDMLEGHNYYLRLCYKDFICFGAGASALIKKEEPVKRATLQYSRPLPCLCIEGWSAVMDAPRVQVCPFKDRVEELWSGVAFDPLEGTLSWESLCPVTAVVTLCQKSKDGVCMDLPHASQNITRGKITFTEVDPHPQLCIKFTVGPDSWTRCPFADGRFQAWRVVPQSHEGVKMLSQITAVFSVGACVKSSGLAECQITRSDTVHVGRNIAVDINLAAEELCNSCIQVKRLDVKFAATVVHCFDQCNELSPLRPVISSRTSLDLTWVIVPAGVCLSAIIIIVLVLHVLLTVSQRRKQKRNGDEKQIDPGLDCVVPALQTHPHRGILVPDSPQCGNTEKANLISK
ncbi:putative interleukin-17 receptor E-like isoform X1 [Lates japonicus]|uniref:Interleukin-17 receptor E-like isoform X1 n=1 Tax=Lates japonicus TaxID=270547 RepID=A0AAD3N087_LATJO|nr:putative interleukin-17 receptor E-like isoform X1 [Lates japonicus]